ncbi:MAG TPA: hypothetical protein VFL83_22595 [Anaeromyxobacter sp.]|nr:hypothetical protein [Anaeromyxobacter sp.]
MPRAFDIAAATTSVTLDASLKAETVVKVSNALKRDVRVRARVVPEGKTGEKWFTLDAPEKDLKADGTATFAVKIAVPAGTPPGDYAWHLLAATVANPDEEFTEGPSLSFKVAAVTEPVKKPFPWWIVAVAAAVLLVGGGVAWFLLRDQGVELGGACGEEDECAEGKCVARDGVSRCLLAVGEKADKPEFCVTGALDADKKCKALAAAGEPCPDGKCGEGSCVQRGEQSLCLLADGAESGRAELCESGLVVGGKCSKLAAGAPCVDGKCSFGLECFARNNAKTCLVAVGQACATPKDCSSGRCDGQRCAEIRVGTACNADTDCDGREMCATIGAGRLCLLRGGLTCQDPRDCASQFCKANGTCAHEYGQCADNFDCQPKGWLCWQGYCRKMKNEVCAGHPECASGYCPSGTCQDARQCVPDCKLGYRCVNGTCLPKYVPGDILKQLPVVKSQIEVMQPKVPAYSPQLPRVRPL